VTRVMVFIDGSAMYFGLREVMKATDIDFQKFIDYLVEGRDLVRTYYYNSRVDQAEDPVRYKSQMRFYGALDNIPYFQTKFGRLLVRNTRLRCRNCGRSFEVDQAACPNCGEQHNCRSEVQKGVDVKLATDLLVQSFKNNYDTAVLVTGDGDLAEAVEQVSEEGKHVENVFFQKGSSPFLRSKCDIFRELTVDVLKPMMGVSPGPRRT
jgi:uncharacterized LabA/DUF88 family protein